MKSPSLAAGHALAHYRVTAALGVGGMVGMGEVYCVTDTKLGREPFYLTSGQPQRSLMVVAVESGSSSPRNGGCGRRREPTSRA